MVNYKNILMLAIFVLAINGRAYPEMYKSYQECRKCHSDIFKLWSGSLHAKSFIDPSFQASYVRILLEKGEEVGRFCLTCHAPAAYLNEDSHFESHLAAEGVSCWTCHSISSINHDGNIDEYYNFDTTGMLYGPYETDGTSDHPVKYSALHLKAELCAGCHEFINENGVGILETFSEWQASPYKMDEVHCQNCHMPIMADLSVVDGQELSGNYVTAHEFQGGHSQINLAHAVNMNMEATRKNDQVYVTVQITNAESGHKLPTGVPIRRLVLQVSLKNRDNVEISSARRVYRKVLIDEYGTVIENAPDMFLKAANIYSDNRISPKETRVENFVFTLPRGIKKYTVEAVLNYEYTRQILENESVKLRMARNKISSKNIK